MSDMKGGTFISKDQLLPYWQGHRRLTRRTIEAFPEEQLFTYSIGDMRPFGEMGAEMLMLGAPFLRGLVTGDWKDEDEARPGTKSDMLRLWDEGTEEIDRLWPELPAERLGETVTIFGRWTGRAYDHILYAIDNEVHHRGQGYVYLRALGIAPPPFYDRR